MSCYHPLRVFDTGIKTESGKRQLIMSKSGLDLFPVSSAERKLRVHVPLQLPYVSFVNGVPFLSVYEEVPCGRCIGCRLDYSRMWAIRCVLELSECDCSSFVTLTYDDEHLPPGSKVSKPTLQKFLKRLRKLVYPKEVRYFACGEYGSRTLRPHYHLIIFGHDFPDRYKWSSKNGNAYYRSPSLEKLWPFGQSLVGDVSFNSCAYVARYVMKKSRDQDDILKPFLLMSRRPGIGSRYLQKNMDRLLDLPKVYGDFGSSTDALPPKYFDYLLDKDPELSGFKADYKAYKQRLAKEASSLDLLHFGSSAPLEYKECLKIKQSKRLERS